MNILYAFCIEYFCFVVSLGRIYIFPVSCAHTCSIGVYMFTRTHVYARETARMRRDRGGGRGVNDPTGYG